MSSTEGLYLVFLATGFTVGFGHCAGMCGPIVVSLCLSAGRKGGFLGDLLYNGGRITTYGVLGGIMGATGSFTVVASRIADLQKGMMILAGLLVVLLGLAMSGWTPFARLGSIFSGAAAPQGAISRGFRRMTASQSRLVYYPLGLLLGLLPCGPVYTALVAAAGTGMEAKSPVWGLVRGTALMLAFGLGTTPALLIVARLASPRWLHLRGIVNRISAVLMVAVGVYLVIRGIRY